MSTLGKKGARINLKIHPALREEFQAAARLRGGTMSTLLHQYIVKVVREEKERDPQAFAETLTAIRAGGAEPVEMPAEDFEALHKEANKDKEANKVKPAAAKRTPRRNSGGKR
ncbi:MAG TPA: hypothetical protein VGX48_17840 [Pyrinomonadaceae bacterium]|nr:hypothetical protein [Pyrinomonadaceae bacterium]